MGSLGDALECMTGIAHTAAMVKDKKINTKPAPERPAGSDPLLHVKPPKRKCVRSGTRIQVSAKNAFLEYKRNFLCGANNFKFG